MTPAHPRKGANRAADIPEHILKSLSCGQIESVTLAEAMALDQATLVRAVFPALSTPAYAAIDAVCALGVVKRMASIAQVLLTELGPAGIAQCSAHRADTVRAWACFMIGYQANQDVGSRLSAIRPLADDAHFGVREWAWMAVRPKLIQELSRSIALLAPWTLEHSERLRRFASEALRPRGVWCAHITALKRDPALALQILAPLHADPSRYVQDSVANWLNDAAKDHPDWVRDLCAQWLESSPTAATLRICQRGLRNL